MAVHNVLALIAMCSYIFSKHSTHNLEYPVYQVLPVLLVFSKEVSSPGHDAVWSHQHSAAIIHASIFDPLATCVAPSPIPYQDHTYPFVLEVRVVVDPHEKSQNLRIQKVADGKYFIVSL